MKSAAWAGVLYFAIAFTAGFTLGVFRVLALQPRIGETAAVLAELPVMLAICWSACGLLVRRLNIEREPSQRVLMGAVAFSLLLGAESALGLFALGRTVAEQANAFLSPAGALGLAGQVAFALFPVLRLRRS